MGLVTVFVLKERILVFFVRPTDLQREHSGGCQLSLADSF